jgi:hypothetical protein
MVSLAPAQPGGPDDGFTVQPRSRLCPAQGRTVVSDLAQEKKIQFPALEYRDFCQICFGMA